MSGSRSVGVQKATRTAIAAKAIVDYNRARIKTEKQREEKLRLENAIMRADYLKRADVMRGLATVVDGIVSKIMACDAMRSVKEELLKDLAGIPLIFEEVAHAQSRLAVAKAKKAKAEEVSEGEAEE